MLRAWILAPACLLCACAAPLAPTDSAAQAGPIEEAYEAGHFPEAWVGSWQGEVTMFGPEGERMRFSMTRIIAPSEDPARYDWTTIYSGDAGEQVRRYSLMLLDPDQGKYAIDEHNGIVLDARYLDDTLFSWFEVQGTRLMVRERLGPEGKSLQFEIATSQGEPGRTGEQIPVLNYLTTGLQRAILHPVHKVKDQ